MQNIPTKVDGVSTLPAAEFNQMADELENAITTGGLSLSSGDVTQLAKSLANYSAVGQYYTDSGTANAKVLSVTAGRAGITAYLQGTTVTFLNLVQNTGAVTINVNGLGVKDLTDVDANPLRNEDLVPNALVRAYYDGIRFRLISNEYKSAVSLTASTTLDTTYSDRVVLVDTTAGSVVLTLPPIAITTTGSTITFIRMSDTSNNVMRIRGADGLELIGGVTQQDFYGKYDSVTVRRGGTQWFIVANTAAPITSGAHAGASVSVTNNTTTLINFERLGLTQTIGLGTALDSSFVDLTNDRIYGLIPGWYLAIGTVEFAANATGYREMGVLKNGSTPAARQRGGNAGASAPTVISCQDVFYLNGSTDYLQLNCLQTSGGTLNCIGDLTVVFLSRKLD